MGRVLQDGVKLLEALQRLVVVSQLLVHQTKVVQGLGACGFHTEGLVVVLLGPVKVVLPEKTVAFVY